MLGVWEFRNLGVWEFGMLGVWECSKKCVMKYVHIEHQASSTEPSVILDTLDKHLIFQLLYFHIYF